MHDTNNQPKEGNSTMETNTINQLPNSISRQALVSRAGSNVPPERVVFEGKVFDGTLDYISDPVAAVDAFRDAVLSTFETVERTEWYDGFTLDEVAVALDKVLNLMDGGVPQIVALDPTEKPSTRRVPVGYDYRTGKMNYAVVPGGAVSVPGLRRLNKKLPAWIRCGTSSGRVFIQANVIRGDQGPLDGVFGFVRDWASTNSIYLGQAVDINFGFINLTNFKPENVALTEKISVALDLMVRQQFKNPDRLSARGQSPKTSALLYGPPGGGKTMTAQFAEYIAVMNGGVVIHVDPSLGMAGMARADKMSQRLLDAGHTVMIVFEDVEKLAGEDRAKVLEILDGGPSKYTRRIVIGTTNFLEQIDRAMIRPGRFDTVLYCGLPDLKAFTQLIKVLIAETDRGDIDYEEAFPHFEGYSYAMIANAVSFIIRSAIANDAENENGSLDVGTQDLINGAMLMRDHHELLNEEVVVDAVRIEDLIRGALTQDFDNLESVVDEYTSRDNTDYSFISDIVHEQTDSVVEGRLSGAVVEKISSSESQINTN